MRLKNIKNKFTGLTVFAVIIAGMFSCQTDLLNPVPKTSFSDAVVFDTPTRIDLQVNGMYTTIKSGNFLGGRYQVYGDIRAEDFLNRTNNGITGLPVWNHTLTETDQNGVVNTWNAAYSTINQVNVFLQGMTDNASKFVPPVFPATYAVTANNYVAEARFLRAVCYYSLLQLYARPYTDGNGSQPGLPIRLKAEKNSSNNDLARSTVAEVYTQILDDLNFAETNLPLDYAGTTQALLRVTRAHRNTAIAFKTRVYLSMADYPKVITEANKIVSAVPPFSATAAGVVPNALNASPLAPFAVPQQTLESIFSLPFTAQNTPGTQNQLGSYFGKDPTVTTAAGEYSLNTVAGGIVADLVNWPATDTRRTGFLFVAGGNTYTKKYPTGSTFTDNAPVIRYAEVLLNLAEARVRSIGGGDPQAIALLNAVHGRSDGTIVFAGTITADQVLMEKRIEFLGEGLRNFDLMRLKVTIPGKGSIPSIPYSAVNYIFPIPSSELVANTLMTRNN